MHLYSCHCLKVSTAKGRTRSEVMFQWLPEGGMRFITILGPCIRPWGTFSGSYSSMGVVVSPKKTTCQTRSPPDCQVHTVWSLKPLKKRGAIASPVLIMVFLVATSNKMGCCVATGITSLISEMLTNMRHAELNLFSDSTLEPAACHTCRCM